MEVNEESMSLQTVVNVSSSETEGKEELPPPLKKNKITKSKSEQIKKTPKQRVRRVTCRLTKTPSKRHGKNLEEYQSYTCSVANEINSEDSNKNCFRDLGQTSYLSPIKNLLEKHELIYEIKSGIKMKENCFFIQDKYMNKYFKYYPDYICIDMLCELIELELNLYLFISIDSNGVCEIVALGLLKSSEAAILWLCGAFKKHNLNWQKIKFIMSDKIARSNEVVKNAFPEKPVLISFFHSMKSLKKDLSKIDVEVTDETLNKVVTIFDQMVFTSDDTKYSELLKQLKTVSPAVSSYFRKVWHQKKESWTLSQQLDSKVLLKSFNVYLNSIRKTIRPILCSLNSIERVINSFFSVIENMRKEKFQNFTSVFEKLFVNDKQTVLLKYSKLLTPFAAKLIFEQISNSNCNINVTKLSPENYLIASKYVTNRNSCSCSFFQSLSLPCFHIFSLRKIFHLHLFDESLYSCKWLATNYRVTYIDLLNTFAGEQKRFLESDNYNFYNYECYFNLSAELWPLLLECNESVSQERITIFNRLLDSWDKNIKIKLRGSLNQPGASSNNAKDVNNDYWKEEYGISLNEILDSDDDDLPTISF